MQVKKDLVRATHLNYFKLLVNCITPSKPQGNYDATVYKCHPGGHDRHAENDGPLIAARAGMSL